MGSIIVTVAIILVIKVVRKSKKKQLPKLWLYQLVSYLIGWINKHTDDHDPPVGRSSEETDGALTCGRQEGDNNESIPSNYHHYTKMHNMHIVVF